MDGCRMVRIIVVSLVALGTFHLRLAPAQAGKVKVWHHDRPEHFDKAQFKQAVVSNEGAVRLSKQLQPLVGLDAAHVWDIVEDKHGNLFVATGNEGKIFQVTPQGNVSIAYESQDTEVLCLALASDGTIYAGTGPKGRTFVQTHGDVRAEAFLDGDHLFRT